MLYYRSVCTHAHIHTHTYLNQMPDHFQMLHCRTAFVKEEEGEKKKKLTLHVQILGFRLHETGLVQKIVQLHSQRENQRMKTM